MPVPAAAGHLISFSAGKRTRSAKGCQSPVTPLSLTRNCKGPNADAPNAFAGLSVTTATLRVLKRHAAVAPTFKASRERLVGRGDFDALVV